MRALDQRHPPEQRIVDDPYAELFLTAPVRALLRTAPRVLDTVLSGVPGLATFIRARHRYIDDALAGALVEGVDQIVLLGAGYDTRLYRFADRMGQAAGFEVDHPATGARKEAIVARNRARLPDARIVRVPVDFRRQSLRARLLESGFVPGRRTFWVWEGVTMYLERTAVLDTLDTLVALSGADSRVAIDFWFLPDASTLGGTVWRLLPAALAVVGEPVTFSMHPGDVEAFLGARGVGLLDLADRAVLSRRYVPSGRAVLPSLYVVTARLGA